MQDNDPLVIAEQLLHVKFEDNGVEPINKVTVREKTEAIGRNAREKLRAQAGVGEEVKGEMVVEFED